MDYRSCRNLAAMFFDEAARQGDRPFLWAKRDGTLPPISWREAAEAVSAAGARPARARHRAAATGSRWSRRTGRNG